MAKVTFDDKVDLTTKDVPEINKITADNINQLKDGVNSNELEIEAIQGASAIYQVSSDAEMLAKYNEVTPTDGSLLIRDDFTPFQYWIWDSGETNKGVYSGRDVLALATDGESLEGSTDIFNGNQTFTQVKEEITDKIKIASKNFDILPTLLSGYYDTNNVFHEASSYGNTGFIDVSDLDSVIYTGYTIAGSVALPAILGYDENENHLGTFLTEGDFTNEEVIISDVLGGNVKKIIANFQVSGGKIQGLKANKSYPSLLLDKNSQNIYEINKSWGVIGHSIWYFDQRTDLSTGDGVLLEGYQTKIQQHIVFSDVSKYAYSGNSLGGLSAGDSSSILSNSNSWVSHDIFTYDSITNDFKRNIPIGTTLDFLNDTGRTTYYGALRQLHDILKGLNPKYRMICANALKRDNASYTSWSSNTEGHTLTDYSDALEWVANRVSWLFINQFQDSGISDDNLSTFTYDGLHPNNEGYKFCYKIWVEKFKQI